MSSGSRLKLLVPGMLGPLPPKAVETAPRQPALETFLARGYRESAAGGVPAKQIQSQFDFTGSEPLPAGAVGCLGEGDDPGADFWLVADPVHLRPDRDRVMLFAGDRLELRKDEAEALAAEFNRMFSADGMRLHVAAANRWYLRVSEPLSLTTTPTTAVNGRYIDHYLPTGADASRWHTLSSEMQMLLHASPINSQRETRGLPTVNGLWCWGGGHVPKQVRGDWQRIFCDDPLSRGWARLSGAAVNEPAAGWTNTDGAVLRVHTDLAAALAEGDLNAWLQAQVALETELLQPALKALRDGHVARLELEADDLRLRLDLRALRRFWRRLRPWYSYLNS